MRRKKVCFVSYGSTEYSRKSEASVLTHYANAIREALQRVDLHKREIQGLSVTTQSSPDYSPHVAEQLGLELDWVLNGDYGGAGGVMSVRRAADAKVKRTAQYLLLQNLWLLLMQAKCYRVGPLPEPTDGFMYSRVLIGDDGVEQADFQFTDKFATQGSHVGCEIVHALQQALYRGNRQFTFLGKAEASPPPLTKLDT